MNWTNKKNWFDTSWRLALIVVFATLALVYFAPAVIEGKDLYQPDVAGTSGTAQDVRDHLAETGEMSYWTNSLFGGMPMYQIYPKYPSLNIIKKVQDIMTLQWPFKLLPSYSWLIFAMLGGFYLLMRSLDVRRLTALLGAVMWAFSSYFIILIVAGHIWKLSTLAFIPPTIAGIIYIYRRKYLLGGLVTALFATLQLMSNHVQMSYYFAFLIFFLIIGYSVDAIKQKDWRHLLTSWGTLTLSSVLSIAVNSSNLYHTYEYSRATMRGGSALAQDSETPRGQSGGLDKEYITQWSYGKAETLSLLIPNIHGGASGYLAEQPKALESVPHQLRPIVAQMNQYWGDQPFTAGPVYVGAFVMTLFILGAFVVRGPIKWALLAGTLLSIALSWGHNLMWLSDWFIDYFPLYNKFRTVSSILVVAELTIPTLAILALVEFVRNPREIVANKLALSVSLGATLGLSLLLALVPSFFFDFTSQAEQEMMRQYITNPEAQSVFSALKDVRASLLSADAWRSAWVIMLCVVVCYLYSRKRLEAKYAISLIMCITLIDLWMVDKRYLNDGHFIATSQIASQAKPVTEVDRLIKTDADPHYRVLNMSVSPFNDATTSFNHRSVGGYHAAKLSRYQDLIDNYLIKQDSAVLGMLDTKYIIYVEQNQLKVLPHPEPLGAAWLISPHNLVVAKNAQQEMDLLGSIKLKEQAVVHQDEAKKLASLLSQKSASHTSVPDTLKAVELIKYTPNYVHYRVNTAEDALLVMSEVYYPHGWQMTIDGTPTDITRANYVLRAASVKAGTHDVELRFDPISLRTTELISYLAQGVWLLILLLWLGRRYIPSIHK